MNLRYYRFAALAVSAGLIFLAGCKRSGPAGYQGYLEGEYVYVGSQIAGRLDSMPVKRGDPVEKGATLFNLDRTNELAAQRQAAEQLAAAQARLDDLRKGARPTEIDALQARLNEARAAAELSKNELDRQSALARSGVLSASDFDQVRLTNDRNLAAVQDLLAQIETARLGGRADAITAAEADVRAATAARERADWSVEEKVIHAPAAGPVVDTLFRVGEVIPAGNPVVVLLPPENIKLRFFVPEPDLAKIKVGAVVHVSFSGEATPLQARISFVAPKAEFTPPVLYNRDNRAKLVFMIEGSFDAAAARDLHPGQPVDVSL